MIFVVVSAFSSLVPLYVEGAARNCGIPKVWPKLDQTKPQGRHRIVSGYESTPHSFPWIASMSRAGQHNCGGSIIRCPNSEQAKVIVSAAHCFYGRDNRNITLRLGAHNLEDALSSPMEQTVDMKHVEVHDGFSEITMANDISLIQLAKPVDFNEWIQPICLAAPNLPIKQGVHVTVSGWGAGRAGGSATSRLQQVDLRVMDTRFCNKYFPIFENYLEFPAMICAGYRDGKYDACQGDSGGPLITEMEEDDDSSKKYFTLVGAVSFGEGCAEPNQPGIYTRISNYLDWLDTKMKKMCA